MMLAFCSPAPLRCEPGRGPRAAASCRRLFAHLWTRRRLARLLPLTKTSALWGGYSFVFAHFFAPSILVLGSRNGPQRSRVWRFGVGMEDFQNERILATELMCE